MFALSASAEAQLLWTSNNVRTSNARNHFANSIAFSPNGTMLLSGGSTIRLWDTATGLELRSIRADGFVTALAFSPDGLTFASGDADGHVRVWNVLTGQELYHFDAPYRVSSVVFSPADGNLLAAVARHTDAFFGTDSWLEAWIHLWDLKTGQQLYRWDISGTTQLSSRADQYLDPAEIAFLTNQQLYAVSSLFFQAWDLNPGQSLGITGFHPPGDSTALIGDYVAISPSGRRMARADNRRRTIGVWTRTHSLYETLRIQGEVAEVRSLAFPQEPGLSHDLLAIGRSYGTIRLWDIYLEQRVHSMSHGDEVHSIAISGDERFLASLSVGSLKVWTLGFAESIADQVYPVNHPISPLELPKTIRGTGSTYTLSPALPEGLNFNPSTRIINGTPTVVTPSPVEYTYKAAGVDDSLTFNISVYAPISFFGTVDDQTYLRTQPITPLILPEVTGGIAPLTYTLTPTLTEGLIFDPSTRTLSGTPTESTSSPVEYTYTATDANGVSNSLIFKIHVYAPVSFSDTISNQDYPRAQPITPLILPEALGGISPITYTLTPTLAEGLRFDASTRTLSGTPTSVTSVPLDFTYTATGADGSSDSLEFQISVYSPVSVEAETLPETFTVIGNYPNPFQSTTQLMFDLPRESRIRVEVMDLIGRQMLTVPATTVEAGWAKTINLSGDSLPAGFYLYRVVADSPEGSSFHTGSFVRVR